MQGVFPLRRYRAASAWTTPWPTSRPCCIFAARVAGAYLYDNDFLWTALENESFTIPKEVEWGLLSVFCLGDRAEGVDETGVQYPLKNAVLTSGFPLGVSNHILAQKAKVAVRKGALLVGWQLPPLG